MRTFYVLWCKDHFFANQDVRVVEVIPAESERAALQALTRKMPDILARLETRKGFVKVVEQVLPWQQAVDWLPMAEVVNLASRRLN
jgi:hypothetical protein